MNRPGMLSGMEEIGVRRLHPRLSQTLRRVKEQGKEILVTRYNRPAAVLVSVAFYEEAVRAIGLFNEDTQKSSPWGRGSTRMIELRRP